MPTTEGVFDAAPQTINPLDLLPADRHYYRFMGSLTTPPCSEGVHWHVMQQPITASTAQIEAYRKLFSINARTPAFGGERQSRKALGIAQKPPIILLAAFLWSALDFVINALLTEGCKTGIVAKLQAP